MNITMKQISMMVFGSVAWLICAVVLPMHQTSENAGFAAVVAGLSVGSAYASDGNEDDDDDAIEAPKVDVTCVSLARLKASEDEDKSKEDDDKAKEDDDKVTEDDGALAEHALADEARLNGDEVGYSEHEEKAKEHEDKAAEDEDKAKEHEDKAKEYEDKSAEIASVSGNCTVLVTDADGQLVRVDGDGNSIAPTDPAYQDGSPKTEKGVWILGSAAEINAILSSSGGAGNLFDSIVQNADGSLVNPTPDSTLESYREIRGE